MHLYEIRLLNDDRYSARAIMEQLHASDYSAVHAASRMAKGGPFEVWRDLECVYGLAADRPMLVG